MLIGENGIFKDVPKLSANLMTAEAALQLIPKGYDDIVEACFRNGEIVIRLLKDEYKENDIVIPSVLFVPALHKVSYPQFLIERNIFTKKPVINYFDDKVKSEYIFNQNQILYICLQHRFEQYRKHNIHYSNLLKDDIKAVKSFVAYIPTTAYNAQQKSKHSYAIMSLYNQYGEFKAECLGSMIDKKMSVPNADEWRIIAPSLPVQFSSDSGAGKAGKLVLQPYELGSVYRSVGHHMFKDRTTGKYMVKSLFKCASNIGARAKTHTTSNAFAVYEFKPTSVFAQDWVYNTLKYPDTANPVPEGYEPKDECYKEAIVVIRSFNKNNNEFLYGEVQMNESLYDTFVWEDKNIIDNFDRLEIPEDGTIIYGDESKELNFHLTGTKILLGYAEEGAVDRPIYVENAKAVQFVRQSYLMGPAGKSKLTVRVAVRAKNARIDSNTGLKGVTKGKPYLGKIVLADGTQLKPELAFGMNSFKAKGNGIAAARAALAVKLKTYKPKHWSGLLNTLDEAEMEAAANSLPEYKFINEFGKEEVAQIGIVYYRYTEIADRFKSFRKQSTSHETGRNLFHNKDNRLYHHMWDTYVDAEMKEALVEFQKVLCGSDAFEGDGDLPYYTIASIKRNKTFTIERDVFTGTILDTKSEAIYLNEEWNPDGFFLDFRAAKGPLIRVPPARVLNLFVNKLQSGSWRHHYMFISLGKIIAQMIYGRAAYIFDSNPNSVRQTLSMRYLKDVKGIMFTSDESKEMNITTLTRPMIPGMAAKQSHEPLLPPNTALILCPKTYRRAVKNAFGEDGDLETLMYGGLRGLHVRSPSLWRTQVCNVAIWNADEFRIYLHATHGINLDKYLLTEENDDLIFFSGDCLGKSHSDVDGDHSSLQTLDKKGQELLRDFELSDICESEVAWTQSYIQGEFESNLDLFNEDGSLLPVKYKLYDIPMETYKVGREEIMTYSKYFFQSLEAKVNVGSSTNDSWVFAMILEAYTEYAKLHNYTYTIKDESFSMVRLSRKKFFDYHSAYIRGLQDFVVSAIKHSD